MNEIICKIFNDWINRNVSWYMEDFAYPDEVSGLHHKSLNPFLKTEDDIKVKFGGFLEDNLLPLGYTVHSEITEIYKHTSSRPDLTIHKVNKNEGLWLHYNPNPAIETLRGVIEIKYNNYCCTNYESSFNQIKKDIDKLKEFDENILKFMLVFDEGETIKDSNISCINTLANDNDVWILSNNSKLCTC